MPRNYFPRRDRGGAAASRRRGETAEDLTKVGLATWDHSHRDGAAATWITDKDGPGFRRGRAGLVVDVSRDDEQRLVLFVFRVLALRRDARLALVRVDRLEAVRELDLRRNSKLGQNVAERCSWTHARANAKAKCIPTSKFPRGAPDSKFRVAKRFEHGPFARTLADLLEDHEPRLLELPLVLPVLLERPPLRRPVPATHRSAGRPPNFAKISLRCSTATRASRRAQKELQLDVWLPHRSRRRTRPGPCCRRPWRP